MKIAFVGMVKLRRPYSYRLTTEIKQSLRILLFSSHFIQRIFTLIILYFLMFFLI